MNVKSSNLINFLAGATLSILVISQFSFSGKEITEENEKEKTVRTPPQLPSTIAFCGETAPLHRWDVKERLDREVLYNFYNTPNVLFTLKLANRYFPIISERLKANGIPDDFKYLCVAESNLVTAALSRSGAVSFWQFMDKTAPEYNLVVNKEIDQRYDIEKSTDAACKYLKQAYAKFGSWTAAAASYNCGQTGYGKQSDLQKTNNYYDLFLPEETNRYIFRILTFKYLLENAETLGFQLKEEEKYPAIPYKNIKVTQTIGNLTDFAISHKTNYKVLKLMNPWIKSQSLTVVGNSSYIIKVPK